jgi:hypothetical protein
MEVPFPNVCAQGQPKITFFYYFIGLLQKILFLTCSKIHNKILQMPYIVYNFSNLII